MEIGFGTDPGRIRETNEDSFFVDESMGLFIITDGLGGHQAGEVASRLAIDVIAAFIKEYISREAHSQSLINQSVAKANHEVFLQSKKDDLLKGMGTTVILALISNKNIMHIASVGDSRAYRIRGNQIKQLTRDHTLVGSLVEQGRLTKEVARSHPNRNIITRSLGNSQTVEADIKTIHLIEGDFILLCTDGLTDALEDESIRDIVISGSRSINEKVQELVNKANASGGRDNITAILLLNN